jgi:hypothetical protein
VTVLAFHAAPANAVVYVMPTDESMVDRSPIIVFGEVLSAQPGPDGRSPTTDYLFAVEEVLKGFVAGSGIMVRQPGGVAADGTATWIAGLPMLAEGNRVLLFLRPEANGGHRIVDYGLGMFFETRVGDRLFLLREPSLQGTTVPPGDPAASDGDSQPGYRDEVAFKRWIADRAAGAETPSDYLVQELPERLTVAASPVRLTPLDCGVQTLPARWRNFDRGESVGFRVQAGGQPGMDGGGLSQVLAAMRAWNTDPGSNVNLEFARTVNSASDLREANGGNSITFEDPRDEIDGAFVPGEGGVLALTFMRTTCGASYSGGGQPAREITQAHLVTQDGFERYLRNLDSGTAQGVFQDVMAHELGHALGIDHSANPTRAETARSTGTGRLMQPTADRDREPHADLSTEERNAIRSLYPAISASQDSYCRANDVVNPGNRCDIYNTSFYFEVQSSGTGCLRAGGITSCSGRSQNWRNSTLNGVRITFVASRNSDDSWTISEVDPSPPGGGGSSSPDLVMSDASVDDSSPTAGQSFTLRVAVTNVGDGRSDSTILRYYRSSDSTISRSDTLVMSTSFRALPLSTGHAVSIELTAPSSPGTYYYGACVDPVAGESDTTNNCSSGARLTVEDTAPSEPDLIVEAPRSTESSVAPRGTFRFGATVRNQGNNRSSATTLRYYRSTDSTITISDTQVGTDSIGALSASGTDRQSIGQRAPATPGTYYYGACVDAVAGESVTTNNCSGGVRVVVGPGGGTSGADLVVESPRSTESAVALSGTFRFAATVRNQGNSTSSATTLRYYRSTDSTITTSDTQVGTDPIGVLSASGTDRQSVGQRAPSTDGTYYYGACVDVVARESDTTNNCSSGVRVTVGDGSRGTSGADLVVESPRSTESSVAPRAAFRFAATVRNQGNSTSSATTLRYYRSTDSTITTSDAQVGTDPIGVLSASGTDRQSVGQRAPSRDGTYYYGACVDSVVGESDTANNCSSGVPISVGQGAGDVVGTGFDLAFGNGDGDGIVYAQRRFYVVDRLDRKVYAYRGSDGRHDPAADFDLASRVGWRSGITYAQGRFYVLDLNKVYAYRGSDGRYDSLADFDLATDNQYPRGITYAQGRFYVLDRTDHKVYAYRSSDGRHDPAADFDLATDNRFDNRFPEGITYAEGRFYVVGQGDDTAYAYRSSDGRHDPAATFDLASRNGSPFGITFAGGRLFVLDNFDDRVYAYSLDGSGGPSPAPDLAVRNASVSDSSPTAGSTFTVNVTVRNLGDGPATATTLRYYRSSYATINRSGTQVGTDSVSALSASETSAESISLTAPSIAETYYYSACVDSIPDDQIPSNDCSSGVRVTVGSGGGPDPVPGPACQVGQELSPGGECDVAGTNMVFSVNSRGQGCIREGGLFLCQGGSPLNRNGFSASRISGTYNWRIDTLP